MPKFILLKNEKNDKCRKNRWMCLTKTRVVHIIFIDMEKSMKDRVCYRPSEHCKSVKERNFPRLKEILDEG